MQLHKLGLTISLMACDLAASGGLKWELPFQSPASAQDAMKRDSGAGRQIVRRN